MTATEKLRRLLDERGVEWDGESYESVTFWNDDTNLAVASDDRNGLLWVSQRLTPEQAIAATLGSCNCTNGERTGTCHDEGDPSDFCCSACGVRMFTDTSDTYTMIASDGRTIIKRPNFCPNCGRRVEQ